MKQKIGFLFAKLKGESVTDSKQTGWLEPFTLDNTKLWFWTMQKCNRALIYFRYYLSSLNRDPRIFLFCFNCIRVNTMHMHETFQKYFAILHFASSWILHTFEMFRRFEANAQKISWNWTSIFLALDVFGYSLNAKLSRYSEWFCCTHLNAVGFFDSEHFAILLCCCNGHHCSNKLLFFV